MRPERRIDPDFPVVQSVREAPERDSGPLKGARSIEQIGMGSSPNQDESIVLLVPDQQPVRFDVTFPARRPVPGQCFRCRGSRG